MIGYDLIVERKNEYLNWRYCDPRGEKLRYGLLKMKSALLVSLFFV
jgi:hypothetical protein